MQTGIALKPIGDSMHSTRISLREVMEIVVLVISFYVFMYAPQFQPNGQGAMIPVTLALGFLAIRYSGTALHLGQFAIFSFFLVFALTISQSLAILTGGGDLRLAEIIAVDVFVVIPSALCAGLLLSQHGGTQLAAKLIAGISFVQSAFIFLDFLFVPAREVFQSIVVQAEAVNWSYRVGGLSSATGDGLSFIQFVGFSCAVYLAWMAAPKQHSVKWSVIAVFILVTMTVVGRTGMVLSFLFVAGIVVLSNKPTKMIRRASMMMFIVLAMFGSVYAVVPDDLKARLTNDIAPHAFEYLDKLIEGKGLTTKSTQNLLSKHVVVPESASTWWVGDGYFSSIDGDGNYKDTDVGYFRMLFYVGVIGSALLYLWYIGVFWTLIQKIKCRNGKVVFGAMSVCVAIAHYKFPFLLWSRLHFLVLVILVCMEVSSVRGRSNVVTDGKG